MKRFLLNYQIDSSATISILIVGQPELRHMLRLQLYQSIAQRVNIRFHLSGIKAQ